MQITQEELNEYIKSYIKENVQVDVEVDTYYDYGGRGVRVTTTLMLEGEQISTSSSYVITEHSEW